MSCKILNSQDLAGKILSFPDLARKIFKIQHLAGKMLKIQDLAGKILNFSGSCKSPYDNSLFQLTKNNSPNYRSPFYFDV